MFAMLHTDLLTTFLMCLQQQQQQPLQQRQSPPAFQKEPSPSVDSQFASTASGAHSLLPAKRSHPDSDKDASPNMTVHSPGTEAKQAPATKGSSQNAFALLMQASKGSAKGQPKAGAPTAKGTALSTQGAKQANVGAANRAQGSWQEALQRIAADPERCLMSCWYNCLDTKICLHSTTLIAGALSKMHDDFHCCHSKVFL